MESNDSSLDCSYILVTGANGGLGFNICRRLVDEFAELRPAAQSLRIILTTRNAAKGAQTVARLQNYVQEKARRMKSQALAGRFSFQPATVNLSNLRQVQTASAEILASVPRLDVVICNAGYMGILTTDLMLGVRMMLFDFLEANTYPTFIHSQVGETTRPQELSLGKADVKQPPVGEVFCANVFGHYLLLHGLMPLLSRQTGAGVHPGRIIFLSTIATSESALDLDDIQGLRAVRPYESTKRLLDVLSLTAASASTKPWVDRFLATSPPKAEVTVKAQPVVAPRFYLCHPGICVTDIVKLSAVATFFQFLVTYLARLLGSIWHTTYPYRGACAPVWLALAPQTQLDAIEEADGAGKWGSCTDIFGSDRVTRTEVGGWGFGGKVGDVAVHGGKGRRKGAKDTTEEERAAFEELGRTCWREMEELREEWEARLNSF